MYDDLVQRHIHKNIFSFLEEMSVYQMHILTVWPKTLDLLGARARWVRHDGREETECCNWGVRGRVLKG